MTLRTALAACVALALSVCPTLALADEAPDAPAAPSNPDAPAAPNNPDAVATNHAPGTGTVGTLTFASPMQLGSWGGSSETACASCTTKTAHGGGALFSVGYMWDHVGFDVLGGATVDGGSRSIAAGGGATSSYAVERVGGLSALRVRGSFQSSAFRVALAAGPGVAFRAVSISASFPNVPLSVGTYRALAFTADLSVQVRPGRSTALTAGIMLWTENAGPGVSASYGPAAVTLVSRQDTTLLPYLGFQFGS